MRRFEVKVRTSRASRGSELSLDAPGPAALIDWTQRHAPGREVEFFEGTRSLGRVTFAPDTGVWTIGRLNDAA